MVLLGWVGCSSVPAPKYEQYAFPKKAAFIKKSDRPHENLGWVRAKVNYQSLDPGREEGSLCQNYYNKAVKQLVDFAKEKGGDAVVEIKSVVFLEDGRREEYTTPDCSDDGFEGQILLQGLAVKWKPQPKISQSDVQTRVN